MALSPTFRVSVAAGSSLTISDELPCRNRDRTLRGDTRGTVTRAPTSRSVAVRRIVSPSVSSSTFARIGRVCLGSTMFWTIWRPLRNASRSRTTSMRFSDVV